VWVPRQKRGPAWVEAEPERTDVVNITELQKKYSISHMDLTPVETHRMEGYPVDIPDDGGTVHVLLGGPAVGKTSLALYLSLREAMAGRYVFYMTWDWASQFLGKRASEWISRDTLQKQETFLFDDRGTVESLCAVASILPKGSFIVIDYLQVFPILSLPAGYSGGVEGRCSYISELVQGLARKYGHTFFCLGSMNRESMKGDPGISSGYGTSRIEYSADSVVVASRIENMNQHVLELAVKKNRWGLTQEICCFPLCSLEKVESEQEDTERETDPLLMFTEDAGGVYYDR